MISYSTAPGTFCTGVLGLGTQALGVAATKPPARERYEGYYDYGPRVILQRPIGLVGFMGAGTPRIGHALACRLGLPLLQVDRLIEHDAGMGLSALQLRRGEPVRRQMEMEVMARAARERPAGVLVLGDGALLDAEAQRLASEQLQLVYVRRPVAVLRQAILQEIEAAPERYPEFALAGLADGSGVLDRLLEQREPGYRMAERVFDAERLHPQKVCDALVTQLGLLDG